MLNDRDVRPDDLRRCRTLRQRQWRNFSVQGSVREGALKGIGKLDAIGSVHVKISVTKESETASFTLSRVWTIPGTVLHLYPGRLALQNSKFLVADDNSTTVCEDLLINLEVLRPLRVDTKTLLEANIHALDGTNCNLSKALPDMGKLGWLLNARLDRQCDDVTRHAADRSRVNYHKARLE